MVDKGNNLEYEMEKVMVKKKKQYVEEQIFRIYPDYPILVNDNIEWEDKEKPLHFHYYLQIEYCLEGSGVFKSENRELKVKKNSIMIAAPNMLHTTYAEEGIYTRCVNLFIDIDDLVKLFPTGGTKTKLQMVQESFRDVLDLDGNEYPDILWCVEEIVRLNKEKRQNYKMQTIGILFALLFKIYDVFAGEKAEGKKMENLPIMPAIEYIFEHYMEQIKVAQLAKACHFSESYFRKVFLEMKGMGPMDYVNSIRIREACRKLLESTDTVRVIGEKCGYPSVTTFERNFKQRTGMLPSQWRESQKNVRKKDRNTFEIKRIYYDER